MSSLMNLLTFPVRSEVRWHFCVVQGTRRLCRICSEPAGRWSEAFWVILLEQKPTRVILDARS